MAEIHLAAPNRLFKQTEPALYQCRKGLRLRRLPDIVGWAPSHDKSIKLISRASVPPAIVSKEDREWNQVLPSIVRREHIDDGALLGRRRAIPFGFRHSQLPPCGLKRLAWSQSPHIGVTRSSCQKRAETKAGCEYRGSINWGCSAVKRFGLALGYTDLAPEKRPP